MSQNQLAQAIGVTRAAIFQWEGCGKTCTAPTHENLEKLVEVLGLTMERFYGRIPKEAA